MSDDQVKVTEKTDDTALFLAKVIISMLSGPKISAAFAHFVIPVDQTAAAIVLATVLHKVHDVIKQKTGWKYL